MSKVKLSHDEEKIIEKEREFMKLQISIDGMSMYEVAMEMGIPYKRVYNFLNGFTNNIMIARLYWDWRSRQL